ncbi:unnamed protein product [Thlaspi arvense]|uniref:Uncharacterized protein n=1 Tax=Thlaspi arvense TaxID=13288 RepID=A0AAU9S6A2_THLAR|nr:unnamed protein product [Thlaspi arvense]CAH2059155.1 unnamed protein product [Thlaspi arvense]
MRSALLSGRLAMASLHKDDLQLYHWVRVVNGVPPTGDYSFAKYNGSVDISLHHLVLNFPATATMADYAIYPCVLSEENISLKA